MLGCIMFFIALYVGLSDMFGGFDRYIYCELFDDVADTIKGGQNIQDAAIYTSFSTEPGFALINTLIGVFTANRYIFILLLTLIIYFLLYQALKLYTSNYAFALILFLGLIMMFSFTYLRQLLGIGVAWLSIPFIIKRDFTKYAIIVFIAATIHNSALIFFPLYFVPLKKFEKKTILYIFVGCLIFGILNLSEAIFGAYGDAMDDQRRMADLARDQNAFRIEYLLEAIVFIFIIFKNYEKIPSNSKGILLLNMSLIFCAILLFFIRSLNGGRLTWYYWIGMISTLTTICTKRKKVTQHGILVIAICVALFLRMLTGWGSYGQVFYPYKTFLTPGHRVGDIVWDEYEYDQRYDNDKFYR